MDIIQIDNLDNDIYHNSEEYTDYWSSSNIKYYLLSPKEAFYQKNIAKKKDTEATIFGNNIHDFLASKHIRGQKFRCNIFEPPINNSTGKPYGKESVKYNDAVRGILNPISVDDMALIEGIWQMILESDYAWFFAQEILGKGIPEASFMCKGLHNYKYRPDVLTDEYIFDYKTVDKRSWTIEKLNYRIKEYGYDISASMYQYYEHKRTSRWLPYYIIWLMKEPPYDILISDISGHCYEKIGNNDVIANSGAATFIKLKDQHELCQSTNHWPGLANSFESYGGLRVPILSPKYERDYNEFEL